MGGRPTQRKSPSAALCLSKLTPAPEVAFPLTPAYLAIGFSGTDSPPPILKLSLRSSGSSACNCESNAPQSKTVDAAILLTIYFLHSTARECVLDRVPGTQTQPCNTASSSIEGRNVAAGSRNLDSKMDFPVLEILFFNGFATSENGHFAKSAAVSRREHPGA